MISWMNNKPIVTASIEYMISPHVCMSACVRWQALCDLLESVCTEGPKVASATFMKNILLQWETFPGSG